MLLLVQYVKSHLHWRICVSDFVIAVMNLIWHEIIYKYLKIQRNMDATRVFWGNSMSVAICRPWKVFTASHYWLFRSAASLDQWRKWKVVNVGIVSSVLPGWADFWVTVDLNFVSCFSNNNNKIGYIQMNQPLLSTEIGGVSLVRYTKTNN